MAESVIAGDGFALAIRVSGYESRGAYHDDLVWLRGEAELELQAAQGDEYGTFSANCSVFWTLQELTRFRDELARALERGRGTAELSTFEDQVELKIELSRRRGTAEGRVESHLIGSLEFGPAEVSKKGLDAGLASLNEVLEHFPAGRSEARQAVLRRVPRPPAGLCDSCRHQRLVRTGRGSEFSMCERSKTEPEFPKYPRVPVLECRGFEERPAGGAPSNASAPGT